MQVICKILPASLQPYLQVVPLFGSRIRAGFPSPATDYEAEPIDLNRLLIPRPSSTFLAIVEGDSMTGDGIYDGDLLVIDRALAHDDGCIALCVVNGEFTLKRIRKKSATQIELVSSNMDYAPIEVSVEDDFVIWGVLACSIKSHNRWLHW
jgi:DNA polymerase V